jgi:hypothetical protein
MVVDAVDDGGGRESDGDEVTGTIKWIIHNGSQGPTPLTWLVHRQMISGGKEEWG